jgi:hypothetical protein
METDIHNQKTGKDSERNTVNVGKTKCKQYSNETTPT